MTGAQAFARSWQGKAERAQLLLRRQSLHAAVPLAKVFAEHELPDGVMRRLADQVVHLVVADTGEIGVACGHVDADPGVQELAQQRLHVELMRQA